MPASVRQCDTLRLLGQRRQLECIVYISEVLLVQVQVTLILTGFRVATSEIPMGTGYALQEPSSGKAKVPSFLTRRSMRA